MRKIWNVIRAILIVVLGASLVILWYGDFDNTFRKTLMFLGFFVVLIFDLLINRVMMIRKGEFQENLTDDEETVFGALFGGMILPIALGEFIASFLFRYVLLPAIPIGITYYFFGWQGAGILVGVILLGFFIWWIDPNERKFREKNVGKEAKKELEKQLPYDRY